MKKPQLLFYADETGMHVTTHEAYTRDIPTVDVQGLIDHCKVCAVCAVRYGYATRS